ncbi:MAG: hypothetical protein EAX87_13550 [Candidatus Thorarchaeota archaeon]|nr:hypothetical protein [Candidatus Thorarchaeota archaeon]
MLLVKNLEIETLLSRLREDYSNIFEKVWKSEDFVSGVFIHSERVLRTVSEQSITIIVQHQITKRECEVIVVSSGGGGGLARIDFGSENAAESTFVDYLIALAREHGWEFHLKYPGHRGATCPFCHAFYFYKESKLQDDGSVVCQNCNRSFSPENAKSPTS